VVRFSGMNYGRRIMIEKVIPENHVWVEGDNSNNSRDSR